MVDGAMESAEHACEVYDVVVLSGVAFYIDRPTRREIEHFLGDGDARYATLTIDDLSGSEVLVIRDNINSIYSSSPESRAKERAVQHLIEREGSGI